MAMLGRLVSLQYFTFVLFKTLASARGWMGLCALIVSLAMVATAQISPGMPNFSAYDSHEADTVNLLNNNIMLHARVMAKSGAIAFNDTLFGNFYMSAAGSTWTSLGSFTSGLQNQIFPIISVGNTSTSTVCPGGFPTTTSYTNWYVQTSDGSFHSFPSGDLTDSQSCYHGTFTDTTTDSSGFTITAATNGTATGLYDKAGTSLTTTSMADENGNATLKSRLLPFAQIFHLFY